MFVDFGITLKTIILCRQDDDSHRQLLCTNSTDMVKFVLCLWYVAYQMMC